MRDSSNSMEPSNKAELIECVNRFICYSNKNYLRTHVGLMEMMMMINSLDVSHARMVLGACSVACVAHSLLPHQFHGTVDFWNSSNLKIHDGALFA